MKVEIERKFLLAGDDWRRLVERSELIRDGLIAVGEGSKTRVRIIGDRSTLTVKTKRVHGSRYEFEYDIPRTDAELLLESCGSNIMSKRRHYVPHGGLTWEIDEYQDLLEGIVLAEVELASIDQSLELPAWIGAEVTAEAPYRKINLLRSRQKRDDQENPKA